MFARATVYCNNPSSVSLNGSHSAQLGGLASQTQLTHAHSKGNDSSHVDTLTYIYNLYILTYGTATCHFDIICMVAGV